MMQVWSASEAAPDRLANEDHVFQYGQLVGVLDGATVPEGFDTGCVHGPAWYVRRLAARIGLVAADQPGATLMEVLAAAIDAVRGDHGNRCDLGHPGTPSSTVCLVREGAEHVDYLVLCDSPLVVDLGSRLQVITDDRLETTMVGLRSAAFAGKASGDDNDPQARFRRSVIWQRQQMNTPGGYWVAAADPEAAYHAIGGGLSLTGPDRVRRAALLTDGASYAVDKLGLLDWHSLLALLTADGPSELIRRVRAAEREVVEDQERHRFKRYDDATAALCRFDR
ncbi:hypothetical protein ACI2K4_32350 [Micromonospora sp. NPDC050397]|uniref:hypothetical protein n=1 Tax=Micromonospora sp. NPDC050397 TaxID=3364279 RepID=UPI0038500B35